MRPDASGAIASPSTGGGSGTPVLEVKGVSKHFGQSLAVNNVSFEVYDGEFLFLIGPSGCGKTTTLRMIGGYETPSSGEIVIRGRTMNRVPLENRNIGMVFQSYALFPHMTVSGNVEYGLKTRKMPKAERSERVADALKLVELEDFADRYPAQLSGGQRQRVALARVIVYEPDILLLDEPLANLDKRLRDVMRVELKKLQAKIGITTVYVTHDQEEALTMADRIAVMDGGNILQIGGPSDVYNQPATSFVATFLGETSSFRGTVERQMDGLAHVAMATGFKTAVRHREDVAPGDELTISIRPERIRLSANKPDQKENVFAGTVDFVSYLGAYVVYLIRIDDGQTLIKASEPIPAGRASFREGEHVYAAWEPAHAVYIKG
ncbi:MAG: ABC transporter ATP-binding protein [Gammaproteobacteria bacterium]